jgi:hypothetical protein
MNAALLALTAVLGTAVDNGPHIDASLVNAGAEVKLDHVLVVQNGNEEGLEDGPHLRIFLTNGVIPLSAAGAATTLEAADFAKQAKIYGIVVLADPTGKNMNAVALDLNLPPWTSPPQHDLAAKRPGPQIFQQFQVTGTRASGELLVDVLRGWVSARFDAPITPDPVTQDLSGPAAIDSAPAKVYLAFTQAALKGDMAAMSKLATPRYTMQMNALYSQMGDAAFKRWLAADPNVASLHNSIIRVIVRGDSASVVSRVKEVAHLVFDGASWKMST